MRRLALLLVVGWVMAGSAVAIQTHGSIGGGRGITIPGLENNPCNGTLYMNYDGTADCDGFGGCPFTNIAPGIGYPTGWQNVSIIWGPTQSIGIGAWCVTEGTPTTETSWGRIKSVFR